jgi:hypothetical protein
MQAGESSPCRSLILEQLKAKKIDVEFVINNPSVSLCCLDDENHRAIFAELPPGIDPAQSPFFYQTQFENAFRLFAVQYDDFF